MRAWLALAAAAGVGQQEDVPRGRCVVEVRQPVKESIHEAVALPLVPDERVRHLRRDALCKSAQKRDDKEIRLERVVRVHAA